ncbi:MAG: polysaccharide deacetylase [Lachnospiraceae bacterium]|nr:polysaccharide deacetylase [Lachnospiraceae bacterium]
MNKKRNAVKWQTNKGRKKGIWQSKKIICIMTVVFLMTPLIYCMTLFTTGVNRQTITVSEHEEEDFLIHAAPKKQKGSASSDNTVKETANPRKEREVDQTKIKGKKVYLTFDDGPSKNTEKILSILDKYKVKATFFVIGKTDKFSKKMYKQIYEKGHTLAMHSYTHQYDKIYKTINAYKKDLTQLSDLLFDVTGERPKYLRFPGGSSNSVSKISMKKVIRYVDAKGLTYFDWNVINGDATGQKLTKKQMVNNVISGVKTYNNAMVLMHDSAVKEMTVETLPTILKKLKKMKANILPINDTTVPVQHIQVEKVKKNK